MHAPLAWESQLDYSDDVASAVAEIAEGRLAEANAIADKTERNAANDTVKADVISQLTGRGCAVRRSGA